jgi:hypothetical protein
MNTLEIVFVVAAGIAALASVGLAVASYRAITAARSSDRDRETEPAIEERPE